MKEHFGKYVGPTLIDESQPITAWRTWRLNHTSLTGTWATDTRWQPGGVPTVAECLAKTKGCNLTMRPDCNCGLWACVALSNLLKHGAVGLYPAGVLGRVHLWGFVHVYAFGFRASMGRPLDCWLGNSAGSRIADRLAREYKIDVHVGLPMELVADQDLLAAPRVLTATRQFQVEQAERTRPAAHGRRRCSGCGTVGTRVDRCPTCKAQRASTATLTKV